MTKSVLIVEDEATLRDIYSFILSTQGYHVQTARNGVEGIEQLRAHTPDVVLLDVFMPIMDGKEVLKNIDMGDYPHTKFVACTNLSDDDTRNEMMDLGAHHYVVKATMGPQDLISMVGDLAGA